jgi:endoglucanase
VITYRSRWLIGAVASAAVVVLLVLAVADRAPGDGSSAHGTTAPSTAPSTGPAAVDTPRGHITGLSVRGNQLVSQDGGPVRLLGFNHSGTEYACIEGWGIFDAGEGRQAQMSETTVEQMGTWKGANTVRVPLNEQCWLGLGVAPAHGGATYQAAIHDYVQLLRKHGFVVVLDLHRSAPGQARSLMQEPMPDRDHSLDFWREVATSYKDDTAVVFDVFNEPFPFTDVNSTRAWSCWRDGGCELPSENAQQTYTAAGMNELIATIRSTGARNVIAVGGIHWAETLDRWLEYRPSDPLGNLVASFHAYDRNRHCASARCYDTVLAKVGKAVPLYVGEVGPDTVDQDCTLESVGHTGFSDQVFDWLDARGSSYTTWSWNVWNDCYSLISSYDGTPTPIWGRDVQERLAANVE